MITISHAPHVVEEGDNIGGGELKSPVWRLNRHGEQKMVGNVGEMRIGPEGIVLLWKHLLEEIQVNRFN